MGYLPRKNLWVKDSIFPTIAGGEGANIHDEAGKEIMNRDLL